MKNTLLFLIVLMTGIGVVSFAEEKPAVSFEKTILDQHNHYRAMHGAEPLKWNDEIAAYAQQWAETNARANRMYHRQPNKYGENIYWQSWSGVDPKQPVDSWYSEVKDYNFSRPGFSSRTGHFTQVVWLGSTEVGCGKAESRSGGTYVVCNYNPPGNYMRQFRENVLPKGATSQK